MDRVKKELRRLLKETLVLTQKKPVEDRRQFVRERLNNIQNYCESVGKTFIACELPITCNQYGLGGSAYDQAVLFRGPNEDASVAICVTERGSLLHRNDGPWKVYCNADDVNPNSEQLINGYLLLAWKTA